MKEVQMSRWLETIREQFPFTSIILIMALLAGLFLGMVIGLFSPIYAVAVAGALFMVIIVMLRLNELALVLIVAVHIFVDSYLGLDVYQIAMLMSVVLLFACYFGRSSDHPWTGPRLIWLWFLFLILNIYPTINGGVFSLTNAIAFYLNLVLSAFVMFWLGNIIAKDILSVRHVFQLLSVMAALIAIHTIIEATTGKFLFESARAEAALVQNSNFQIMSAGISRTGSFFGNPNGNGAFLAISFFLPFGLFMESKQLWTRILYLLETLLILMALIFTYSTGSWIGVLAGILAFIFLMGRIRYQVLLVLLIATLAVIALTVFPSQIAVLLAHASDRSEFSLHTGDWQTAIRVIGAFPFFGVGLGNQAYLIRANPYRVFTQTVPLAEPDNAYLQWGATSGIPVMLVFLLLLAFAFWFAWRNWLALDAHHRPLIAGGIAAVIALSVNSLAVDGWTGSDGLAHLGWLIAGVVASPLIGRGLRQQPAPPVDRTVEIVHVRAETSRIDKSQRGSRYA